MDQHVDTHPTLLDSSAAPDTAPCALGTVDNCSKCGDVCPGKKAKFTLRICQSGICQIQCHGEHYDVDGQLKNGCEFSDDTPIHENFSAAKSMGNVDDCAKTKTATAVLPSDTRKHTTAPTDRPNGREDWFKLHITDKAFCLTEAHVDVKLTGLPASAAFQIEAYYLCDGGKQTKTKTVTKTGYGGTSLKLLPSTACTTGGLGDNSGTVYVRVLKTSGPHSSGKYTVEIMP